MATVETLVALTERAADKIRELMAEEPEGEIGFFASPSRAAGARASSTPSASTRPAGRRQELELNGVTVVVDPFSAPYLQGATIDFLDGLTGGGFKIDNPNAARPAGAAHSFPAKDDAEGERLHARRRRLRLRLLATAMSGSVRTPTEHQRR